MAIIDSYSESSYLADQFGQIYPPIKWWFHRLLLWQLIFHYYSESSYLADQVLADLPPLPTSNGNYRFLLWELIFGRPSVGISTPPSNSDFTDCCSDSSYFLLTLIAHIWQTRMFRSTSSPTSNSNYRFLLLRADIWQTQLWADLPPAIHQMAMIDSYSASSYLADQLWTYLPPIKWRFHRLLLWHFIFHSHSENSYLAEQRCWQIYPQPSIKWQL